MRKVLLSPVMDDHLYATRCGEGTGGFTYVRLSVNIERQINCMLGENKFHM